MRVYFVGTALTTVRPVSPWTRRFNVAGLTVAVGLAARRDRARREGLQQPCRFSQRPPVPDALLPRHCHDPGGDCRRAHHAIRRASRRAVARHLWRMCFALFFSIRARVATIFSGAIHDCADASAADPAGVWRDVLLVVEGPRTPHAASARSTRFDATRHLAK
jgi:hypothetical protein